MWGRPFTAESVAERANRSRGEAVGLRTILGMLIQCVTIIGREYQVTWKPEAAAWFKPH
jgi:hypothetical protein